MKKKIIFGVLIFVATILLTGCTVKSIDHEEFTKAAKEKINELWASWVTDIAIDRNTLYLKQDLIDDSKVSIIGLLFWKRKQYDSAKKEEIMNATIDVLSEQSLLDIFKDEDDN